MENEISKFDPSKVMEGVKDRIKATFVSLIPDDAWESMIEKEIYCFTEGRIKIDRQFHDGEYRDVEVREPYKQSGFTGLKNERDEDISPLQQMIRDELRNKFREDIGKYLSSDEYLGCWSLYGEPKVGDAVKKILVENAENVFVNFMSGMMQYAFNDMRNRIISDISNNSYHY